jgi:NitT/TauT family transport system substrate-binding protein
MSVINLPLPLRRRARACAPRALAALALLAPAMAHPARAADSLVITNYGISAVSLPWAVALQKGFIKANGVEIDGILGSSGGGTTIRNFLASKLPVGQSAVSAAVAAIQQGLDIVLIYSPVNNAGGLAWVAPVQSPFNTLADLKGHKVAFSNPRSTTEMVMRTMLARNGLAKDVEMVPSGGIPAGLTLLNQGAVAAAPIDQPALMPPGKFKTVAAVNDYIPSLTWEIGITTRAFAAAHPDTVRGLVRAWRQAVEDVYAHPADAVKIYAKVFETNEEVAGKIVPQLIASHFFSPGKFNKEGLDAMLDGMKLVGALKEQFDVEKVIDRSFLPEDLR